MKLRLLLSLALLTTLAASLRASFYFSWNAPNSVNVGQGYTVEVQAYFSPDYYDDPYADLWFYRNGSQIGSGSTGAYGTASASNSFNDGSPQTVNFSAETYSYYGETGYSSHAVMVTGAPANNPPTAWVTVDGHSHGATVTRPYGGSVTVTVRYKASDPDNNLARIRPQVWHPSGYLNNNGGNFIGQSGGYGEVAWNVTLNENGNWHFWTDAEDTNNVFVNSGAWGDGFRLTVVEGAPPNTPPTVTLHSPAAQTIYLNQALTITSQATDPDGNIANHNLDIQRPDGSWNWQGGFANGEPYTGGYSGSPANSNRSASFTFNQLGTWYVRSAAADPSGWYHSATVAINVTTAPDTTKPSKPTNVRITAFDQSSATFAWDAATDNVGVTGYLVRLNQGSPMFVTGLSHTFSGLSNNTNYLLEVSARDAAGNSSDWGGASASTGGSGGGGFGSGQSLWADVNGDGILDEVVKAGTSDFSYSVDWWHTTDPNGWNIQVNAYWNSFSIFNPGSDSWLNNHVSIWAGEQAINPADRNTTTLGVTLTINPRPGRQMAIYKDPTGSNTLIPALWEVIQPHMGPIAQSPFSYTQIFYSAGSLDGTAIYLAHLGAPVANVQFRDSTGSALTDSIAVNGTTNLFLPANNQVTLNLTNSFGGVIDSAHQVVWQIRDTIGNVLRQGLGINVDFDNLNLGLIAQIVILLDNAPAKSVNANVAKPIFITPAGNPVTQPVDAGTNTASIPDGANEFTYSTASPGVLTVKLKASVAGLANAPQATKDKFKFELDGIGNSTKAWATANPGGAPTITGDVLEAVVTFSGLPANNSDFGTKSARVVYDGKILATQSFEVFFPRAATNHPGGQNGSPNWFHYWSQVSNIANLEYGGPSPDARAAEAIGMTRWSYSTAPNKAKIIVYAETLGKGKSYNVGEEFSGVDMFVGVMLHEAKHADQISRADTLLPTNGNDAFRHGWSWNVGHSYFHNHWGKGADGKWGRANIDDDNNGTIDDAATAPPFEPGNVLSDDIELADLLFPDWPSAWSKPQNPTWGGHPIESEAIQHSDSHHNEHQSARSDWANPGKNHKTMDNWAD